MGKHSGTNSGMGGFVNGASIRFSKYKNGSGGVDAWRDQLTNLKKQMESDRKRTFGTKIPELYSIHAASIVSVQEYGVFCQLGDGSVYKDAMVHVSQIGKERVETAREAGLEKGMKIWVKVHSIEQGERGVWAGKYSLDMRYVDQRNGKDLDPYNGFAKVPDNRWYGGIYARFKPDKPIEEEEEEAKPAVSEAEPSSSKKRKEAPSEDGGGSDSDESTISSDVGKKLKKAKKKLEKMRKKAEKAKKKLGKKAKKSKKAKKGSDSDESAAPSDSS